MNKLAYRWTTPYLDEKGHKTLNETILSGQWSYGTIAKTVERKLSVMLESSSVVLTNSGTSALWIVLSKIRNPEKKQAIIIPVFGYSAAASIAISLGYEIYLADSCEDAPVIDPASISRLMDEKVAIIVGINYFGYSVDWDEVKKVSKGVTLIEDSAGSFGAAYEGKPCGTNADIAIMSFHTSKAVAAGGEGGCIIAKDDLFIKEARIIAKNGHSVGYYDAESFGMNMLMTDIAACFLENSISLYPEQWKSRKELANKLKAIFNNAGYMVPDFNRSSKSRKQNYQVYSLLLENRDEITDIMRINGFEVRPCWPHLIGDQSVFVPFIEKTDSSVDNARLFADKILSFSINPKVCDDDMITRLAKVLKTIKMEGLK